MIVTGSGGELCTAGASGDAPSGPRGPEGDFSGIALTGGEFGSRLVGSRGCTTLRRSAGHQARRKCVPRAKPGGGVRQAADRRGNTVRLKIGPGGRKRPGGTRKGGTHGHV